MLATRIHEKERHVLFDEPLRKEPFGGRVGGWEGGEACGNDQRHGAYSSLNSRSNSCRFAPATSLPLSDESLGPSVPVVFGGLFDGVRLDLVGV
jgi:hypothetical protein